jgi:hypothetical protein
VSSNSVSENEKPAAAGRESGKSPSHGDDQTPPEGQNGEAQPAEGKPRLCAPAHYAAYIGIALFLVWWDPFQWNEASSNASHDLANRVLIGPLYPTKQRDQITVVLFNEATLEHLEATWPVALGRHADILRNIREMGPRAVMVDFIFPDRRDDPSVEQLRDEIQAYQGAGIPLYFARAEGAGLDWIRSDLSEAKLTSIANPTSDGVSRTYDPCSRLPGDHPACACVAGPNDFKACTAEKDAGALVSSVALTAAFELYRDEVGLPGRLNIHEPGPMDVVWSNRLNPTNDLWMRKQTAEGLENLCVDIASSFGDWLRRMAFKSEKYSFRQTCPYSTTVSARMILSAPQDAAVRELVHEKYVFYGGDLTGLEDSVVPPTHVKLPGVYLHAMALDNLLTFGGKYKYSSISLFGGDMGAENLAYLVAGLLAVVVVFFARNERVVMADRITAGQERGFAYFRILWRRWRYWFVFNLCTFVVIVAVCWALYSWAGLSPKNWLGYWGLMTALSGMAKGRLAEAVATTITERFWPALGPIIFMEERT